MLVDTRMRLSEVLTVIVPAAHAKTDVEKRPLPECRGQVILLVGIRDERVVGCHHGNVEMDEVLEEGRLVVTWVARGKLLVGVALNIPVSVDIAGVVRLGAGRLNLLETPLWQVDVASTKIAAKILVL